MLVLFGWDIKTSYFVAASRDENCGGADVEGRWVVDKYMHLFFLVVDVRNRTIIEIIGITPTLYPLSGNIHPIKMSKMLHKRLLILQSIILNSQFHHFHILFRHISRRSACNGVMVLHYAKDVFHPVDYFEIF